MQVPLDDGVHCVFRPQYLVSVCAGVCRYHWMMVYIVYSDMTTLYLCVLVCAGITGLWCTLCFQTSIPCICVCWCVQVPLDDGVHCVFRHDYLVSVCAGVCRYHWIMVYIVCSDMTALYLCVLVCVGSTG